MNYCSRGVISIFCRAKSFVYCCDVFRISFGLARFGGSEIQNCERGEGFNGEELFQCGRWFFNF